MINPTQDDIGRKVFDVKWHRILGDGVIDGFDKRFVYVRYLPGAKPQPTIAKNLKWRGKAGDDHTR